jgi:hypothetical protein
MEERRQWKKRDKREKIRGRRGMKERNEWKKRRKDRRQWKKREEG